MKNGTAKLVLASESAARQQMLSNAGVAFDVIPARIDEAAVRDAMMSADDGLGPSDVAELLATQKALAVSAGQGGRLVLGGDQILSLNEAVYAKAATIDEIRTTLLALSGKTHQLYSAAALVRDGAVVWSTLSSVNVTFRKYGPEFVGWYLGTVGDAALRSVGGYQIEGVGAQLINRIDGDYFAVLGMPLLEVLDALRDEGLVPA